MKGSQNILSSAERQKQDRVNDALALLSGGPQAPRQLYLFEELHDYNNLLKKQALQKQKTDKGLSFKQEAAARLLALGLPLTQIYMLLHEGADFNKTHNLEVFLNNLKILVMAGNVSAFAKKVKIQRPNVYKALNPQGNPSFATIMTITDNLGISLNARI